MSAYFFNSQDIFGGVSERQIQLEQHLSTSEKELIALMLSIVSTALKSYGYVYIQIYSNLVAVSVLTVMVKERKSVSEGAKHTV